MESLDDWAKELRRVGQDELIRAHRHPWLVILPGESPQDFGDKKAVTGFRTQPMSIARLRSPDEDERDAVGWAHPVEKAAQSPYRDRISVGRARNNDISIRDSSISKVQANFSRSGEGELTLTDAGSTNGTFVNGVRLAPGQSLVVRDGDQIRFGQVPTLFLETRALCQVLADHLDKAGADEA